MFFFRYKYDFNIAQNREQSTGISLAESDDDDNIYISDKENIIEDELITYLEEKRTDKKVSLFFLIIYIYITLLYSSNIF
jgi:replicative DNA helicase